MDSGQASDDGRLVILVHRKLQVAVMHMLKMEPHAGMLLWFGPKCYEIERVVCRHDGIFGFDEAGNDAVGILYSHPAVFLKDAEGDVESFAVPQLAELVEERVRRLFGR